MVVKNLFSEADAPAHGERFETLLEHRNLVVERIVSSAEIEPDESVQDQDEWVVLLKGQASMTVDGKPVGLVAGDYLFLPAGTPHTVTSTSQGALWLAVHLHGGELHERG
jgi:cupin 2 domain-containing protein